MKLIFVSATNVMALGIAALEGGQASHVGADLGDGTVIEASFWHGVRRATYEEFFHNKTHVDSIDFAVPNEAAAVGFLLDQVGKKYDVLGATGFLLWRDWSSDKSWYCSELVIAAALIGGKTLADRKARIGVRLSRELAHAWRSATPLFPTLDAPMFPALNEVPL